MKINKGEVPPVDETAILPLPAEHVSGVIFNNSCNESGYNKVIMVSFLQLF